MNKERIAIIEMLTCAALWSIAGIFIPDNSSKERNSCRCRRNPEHCNNSNNNCNSLRFEHISLANRPNTR